MRADRIALQLYTVRDRADRDMLGTLRRVAEVGYRAVELAGYGDSGPREIRATLDQLGMRAASAHVSLEEWEDPGRVFDELHALGCGYAVVPFVPPERRGSAEAVRSLADDFNGWAALCREEGLRFAYHNHDFEFAPLGGRPGATTMWDELVAATDPDLVELELDVYWAAYAGRDPLEELERHAGRLAIVHLKDLDEARSRADVPVGEGDLPWPGILRAADAANARWYVVEQDNPKNSLDDVARALRNLEAMAEQR